MRILPLFKGWTLDARLKEFRKVNLKTGEIIFLPFSEPKGDKLLTEYIKAIDVNSEEFNEVALRIL